MHYRCMSCDVVARDASFCCAQGAACGFRCGHFRSANQLVVVEKDQPGLAMHLLFWGTFALIFCLMSAAAGGPFRLFIRLAVLVIKIIGTIALFVSNII